MTNETKKKLSEALRTAQLEELDLARLEEVAGGVCSDDCIYGCAACCATGTANRKPQT